MNLSAVGSASIDFHLSQTQQSVDTAMVKKIMDLQETQAAQLLDSLQAAVPPPSGLLNILA